jgi:hypothetical protein
MNERIKQLVKQAGINLTPAQFSGVLEDEVDEFTLEKFAELIVRECARVARATPCPYTDELMIQQLGHTWDMASSVAGREIVQHFGVEE